jgi:LDH2 family malate/lactate/ureidoglycolate dehydrogenase
MGNVPPTSGIRVPAEALRVLVTEIFAKTGMSDAHAQRMASLLVATDLRGVVSHGTWQTAGYARMILQERVNPRPQIQVTSETATTRVLDGDGGMGHLPSYEGTQWAIATAKKYGTAAVTTRNHFHFGGAGKYTRMAMAEDCVCLAASSHRFDLDPNNTVLGAGAGSPISIGMPAGEQPPLVLDMGSHFMSYSEEAFKDHAFAFFKQLGLASMLYGLGGILAGIYQPEFKQPQSRWESNQGAFIAVYDIKCFMPVDQFKQEMDRYIGDARRMQPFPGYTQAELPGGMEWQCEQDYGRNGIPLGDKHQQALTGIAAEVGVETPFDQYEHTRFDNE